ncbi:MAG: GNAT family N-acetyltransferase [Chloroflexi bacterium]|nr:MAG: GNAT family N-acetyltransferase [Chloroflexota bacterium]
MGAAEPIVVRYAQRVEHRHHQLGPPRPTASIGQSHGALLDGKVAEVGRAISATISPHWLRDNAWLLARRARQIRDNPAAQRWLLRPIVVRRGARPVAGTINFHGGPDERGMVEVGYVLLPRFRGRGYAIEAVRALLAWAERDPRVSVFRASVSPENERSLNLIAKLGFVHVGEQLDPEDGLELVFELPVRRSSV